MRKIRKISGLRSAVRRIDFLCCFVLLFCLGINLVRSHYYSFKFLYAISWILLFFAVMIINKKHSAWVLLMLGIFFGGLFLKNSYYLAGNHISKISFYAKDGPVIIGDVFDCPKVEPQATSFILNTKGVVKEGRVYQANGKILVKAREQKEISYGRTVLLRGKLSRPYDWINKRYSWRDYLRRQGIYAILKVDSGRSIQYLGQAKKNYIKFLAYRLKDKSRSLLFKYLPSTQAGIYAAIILGERNKLSPKIKRMLIQTGTVHILAISGLHVGILGLLLNLFLKFLRIKRRPRYLLIMPALIFYCLLTGARASVVRACVMSIIAMGGIFFKRIINVAHSLALTALIILIINPGQLYDIGFQLSFLSVVSIFYFSPLLNNLLVALKLKLERLVAIENNLALPMFLNQSLAFVINAISVSLSAWLGLLFLIIYHFKIISPVTVLANLAIVPYLSLVIALGVTFLMVAFLIPSLSYLFALPANLSVVILLEMIAFFNRLPFAYFYLGD